jgi:ubiquinone/menaquinone biosynthesis C-methylase UbiE
MVVAYGRRMRLNDDEYVLHQYRTTENLDTRISVWSADEAGHSPQDVALLALREIRPRRVLEVGSGGGSLALRIAEEIGCEVFGLDSSAAMVSASSAIGIETILGDVRSLPFPDDSFDAVVAAWMLYHVFPLDQGLSELARVLRPGGRLIAITNGKAHMAELWASVGADHDEPTFSVENGAGHLKEYFSDVERHDTATHATFPNVGAAAEYLRSIDRSDLVDQLPQSDWPLRARGATAVFVADKAE